MAFKVLSGLFVLASVVDFALGHGRMIDPASRNAAWRYSFDSPPNYNDNENNCGGYFIQWEKNDGKCGACGDPYHFKNQPHVYPGKYANNIITKTYTKGEMIKVLVDITSNHRGYFRFRIGDIGKPPMTEEKFTHVIPQPDGKEKWQLPSRSNGVFTVILQLPKDLVCEHCVMQWWYKVGNNWGCNYDGTCGLGKGERHESFVNCADIRIVDPDPSTTTQAPTTSAATGASTNASPRPGPSPRSAPTTKKPLKTTKKMLAQRKPTIGSEETFHAHKCKSVGIWRGSAGLDDWCRRNCVVGFCPRSYCRC